MTRVILTQHIIDAERAERLEYQNRILEQASMTRILVSDYERALYVRTGDKLEDDISTVLISSEFLTSTIPGFSNEIPFIDQLNLYIDNIIHPDDREMVRKKTDRDKVLNETHEHMENIWNETREALQTEPTYDNMFRLMDRFEDKVAAEIADGKGGILYRSYSDYAKMSAAAYEYIRNFGFKPGDIVGLIYPTCIDWPVLFRSILMTGCIPLLMNPDSGRDLLTAILKEAKAVAYVSGFELPDCDARYICSADVLGHKGTGVADEPVEYGKYVALCTSGTTGSSRIFLYDAPTIVNQLLSFDEAKQNNVDMPFEEGTECKLLVFLPFHHVFGFSVIYILYSCTGKVLVYLKDKSFRSIQSACKDQHVTHLYCVPMFFNALANGLKKKGIKGYPMPEFINRRIREGALGDSIRSMITGGGHIPHETLKIINRIGYPLYNGFGMTECGIISVEQSGQIPDRIEGSIGKPFCNTECMIKNGADGDSGELFIRGNALFTASIVDGKVIPRDTGEWFDTGDIVRRDARGRLFMEGRSKDVIINASGENIYPDELEDHFKNLPGASNICILGIRNGRKNYEDITLVVEKGEDCDEDAVKAEVEKRNRRLPVSERVTRVVCVSEKLPVSGNLKVKRNQLREDLKSYEAVPVGVGRRLSRFRRKKTEDAEYLKLMNEIRSFAAEQLNIKASEIGYDDSLTQTLGVDSIALCGIINRIEEEYPVEISQEDSLSIDTVRKAAELVQKKMRGEAEDVSELVESMVYHRITDFADSVEYQEIKQRMTEIFSDEYNPYFIPHDSLIRDTSIVDGKEVINLGSYNYLGMSGNPETEQVAIDAIKKYGTSASGSRTLAGEKTLYQQLERSIAEWKHTDDAIVCTGGWATNLTFVSCFMKKGDLILYDILSHNSIISGVKLSGADSRAFPHNKVDALETLLRKAEGKYNKVLIIIEGVYSMDGDIAPVPKFVELKKKYSAFLMVDEAHSGGVIGEHGGGVDDYFSLAPDDVDIKYGTLSKALGTCGGYIAAASEIVEYLRYSMDGFVFSAGISPPLAAACMKAIELIQRDNTEVQKLHANIAYFVRRAKEEGMNTCLAGESAIVPVMVGTDDCAARLSAKLLEEGVFVPPAMYPAVPRGESRMRFTISSTHNFEQLEKAVTLLARLMREEGLL